MTKDEFLAQYDWKPWDQVLMTFGGNDFLSLVDANLLPNDLKCPANKFHSLWRLIDGVPTEVQKKPKPDYREHPLWKCFNFLFDHQVDTLSADVPRMTALADARDWVRDQILEGKL